MDQALSRAMQKNPTPKRMGGRARRLLLVIVVAWTGGWTGALAMPGGSADTGREDLAASELRDEIGSSDAQASRLHAELATARKALGTSEDTLVRRTRALYRLTRPGRTPLAAGFEAVRTHVARVARLRRLVLSGARQHAALRGTVQGLSTQLGQIEQALAHSRTQLGQVQATEPAHPMDTLAGAPGNAPAPASTGRAFYGLRLSDPEPPHSRFASQRGALASPVDGEVRVVPARREESDGPGLEFQAPAGAPVRAVAAGRVAFSDVYGSYGRLVILDHGDNYYTVYGGLGGVEVRVGDDLSRRARLGSIGPGASPALFFEVRKGTRTLDPRAWVGL